jgi:hypothetical protein
MSNVLLAIKVLGGFLLLIAPLFAGFRREGARWVQVAVPLVGLLIEIQVGLTYYVEKLRAARDPDYWHILPLRSFLGGVVVGILLSYLLQFFCARISKTQKDRS